MLQCVVAVPAIQYVRRRSPVQEVVACAAFQTVHAIAAVQPVVAAFARQRVVAVLPRQRVVAAASLEPVSRRAAASLLIRVAPLPRRAVQPVRELEHRLPGPVPSPVPTRQRQACVAAAAPLDHQVVAHRLHIPFRLRAVRKPDLRHAAAVAHQHVVAVRLAKLHHIVARQLQQVVAQPAIKRIRSHAACQYVIARIPLQAVVAGFAEEVVGIVAALQRIVAIPAVQSIHARARVQRIIAETAFHPVPQQVAGQAVRSAAATHRLDVRVFRQGQVDRLRRDIRPRIQQVKSRAPRHHRVQRIMLQCVVAVPAIQYVRRRSPVQEVVACAASQNISARITMQLVISAQPIQNVIANGAKNLIGIPSARNVRHY